MASNRAQVDEVTVSVIWNKLMNITREVGERVVHSAQSYVMANARDLGPVLLDSKGHIVCQRPVSRTKSPELASPDVAGRVPLDSDTI